MKASILIRAYNAALTIERAMTSALAQTHADLEIIVVNDGSTDATREKLAQYTDPRVRVIDQENAGATAAGIAALKASSGEYVTFLDSDDEFESTLVSDLLATAIKENADYVYSDYRDEYDGVRTKVSPQSPFQTIAIGVLYKRAAFEKVGWYRSGVFFAEYDLILRALDQWKFVYVPKSLFTYHRRKESLTGSAARVAAGLAELASLHPTRLNEIHSIRSYVLPAV